MKILFLIASPLFLLACGSAEPESEKVGDTTGIDMGATVADVTYQRRMDCAAKMTVAAYIAGEVGADVNAVEAASPAWAKAKQAGESVGYTGAKVQADIEATAMKYMQSFEGRDPQEAVNELSADISACAS